MSVTFRSRDLNHSLLTLSTSPESAEVHVEEIEADGYCSLYRSLEQLNWGEGLSGPLPTNQKFSSKHSVTGLNIVLIY